MIPFLRFPAWQAAAARLPKPLAPTRTSSSGSLFTRAFNRQVQPSDVVAACPRRGDIHIQGCTKATACLQLHIRRTIPRAVIEPSA
jgi:hypothetical protein